MSYFDEGAKQGKRLHQLEKYVLKSYRVYHQLQQLGDSRRDPAFPTFEVMNALLHAALFRLPSLNSLEANLRDPDFQCLLGYRPREGVAAFSADVMADVLDTVTLNPLRDILVTLFKRAERNKAFRDDSYGTFRCVAIDGWEPFKSYERRCDACMTREVTVDDEVRVQYFHRYVVAFWIAPTLNLTLAIEPVRSEKVRIQHGETKGCGDEGEQTAALRLIDQLYRDYGSFIDAFVLDGLYPTGPVMTKLTKYRYGAFIVTRKKKDDPLRFAEEIWEHQEKPDAVVYDDKKKESVEFYDLPEVDALATYDGSVRMLKALVTRKNGKKNRWAMAMVGKAKKAGRQTALDILRARWHIENTAFHQWVTKLDMDHNFRHTPNATHAVLLIWAVAFNLIQLFFYRRLRKPRKGRHVNDTIRHTIELLYRQVGMLTEPVPWGEAVIDTS